MSVLKVNDLGYYFVYEFVLKQIVCHQNKIIVIRHHYIWITLAIKHQSKQFLVI